MDNKLEKINRKNEENYKLYINRMEQSINKSTKRLIPYFCADSLKILDVGCSNGALLKEIRKVNPDAKLFGLELNRDAIEACDDITIYNKEIFDINEKFDCIIFSSVLHEISSYSETNTFGIEPVMEVLEKANELLEDGGKIIIRDGVKSTSIDNIKITFKNKEDIEFAKRFADEFYAWSDCKFLDDGVIFNATIAKEFLFTYTWGKESFEREVNEQFGIFSEKAWKAIVRRCGFNITNCMQSAEEYSKYLSEKIEMTEEIEHLLSESTILIVANKR